MIADAERDAADAARRAGVLIRPAESVADLRAVAELFAAVWDAPDVAPMPHDLMRSLAHAGGAVHAAYRDGGLAGASVATFGPPASASCYSLIAGVRPAGQGRGAGYALKLAQRAWALAAGATSMTWTYDPLLRRNAYFNLGRLGARVTEYLEDFYGEIADGVNDPETDRLAVTWDLAASLPAAAFGEQAGPPGAPGPDGRPGPAPPAALAAGPRGEPVARGFPAAAASAAATAQGRSQAGAPPDGGHQPRAGDAYEARCWIPEDIVALRRADPAMGRRWRLALRDVLGGALSSGWRVAGLADPGWYVLRRGEEAR